MSDSRDSNVVASEHTAALALLEEVRDYMLRLPVVPITRNLCAKISRHLEPPIPLPASHCWWPIFPGKCFQSSRLLQVRLMRLSPGDSWIC